MDLNLPTGTVGNFIRIQVYLQQQFGATSLATWLAGYDTTPATPQRSVKKKNPTQVIDKHKSHRHLRSGRREGRERGFLLLHIPQRALSPSKVTKIFSHVDGTPSAVALGNVAKENQRAPTQTSRFPRQGTEGKHLLSSPRPAPTRALSPALIIIKHVRERRGLVKRQRSTGPACAQATEAPHRPPWPSSLWLVLCRRAHSLPRGRLVGGQSHSSRGL